MSFDLFGSISSGGYVFDWNQSEDPIISIDQSTKEGACVSLSMWWVIKHKAQEDFWAWRKTSGGAEAVRQVQRQEAKFARGGEYEEMAKGLGMTEGQRQDLKLERIKVFMREHGIKEIDKRLWKYSLPGLIVANQMTWAAWRDVYSIIMVWGADGGAHAMASFVWKDGFVFMDPNHGEIYFPKVEQAKTWFRFWFDYEYKTQLFQGLRGAMVYNFQ
jgi:hypothetical protein